MRTFLVALLAISASTNADKVTPKVTEKRGITSTGDFGSEHGGLYSSDVSGTYGSAGWSGNVGSSSWTPSPGFSHQSDPVPSIKHTGFGAGFGQAYHPPTEINTYIQPTKIITRFIKVPVPVAHPVPIEVKYPVAVPHPVPVYINKPYPVNINRPVPVYITKPVAVPVTVGQNAESPVRHGFNDQAGAPVVEKSSSGAIGHRQEHYGNAASAIAQSFTDNTGYQNHQDYHAQQFSSSYANSFDHSEFGSQPSQPGYNYETPPRAWN